MDCFTLLQRFPRWLWLALIIAGALVVALIVVMTRSDPHLIRTIKSLSPTEKVVFSPDGQVLAASNDNGLIQLWRANDGWLIRILEGHTKAVYSLAFSPNGDMLASGSADGTIRLWQISDGSLIRILKVPSTSDQLVYDENQNPVNIIYSVAFSPNGQFLASGGLDNTIRLWSINDGQLLYILQKHTKPILSVTFSHDGRFIASGSEDNIIYLWKISDARHKPSLIMNLNSRVFSVIFSPDDTTLASGSDDGIIRLWSVRNGQLISTFDQQDTSMFSIAFSPDGKNLASGGGAVFIDGIAYRPYDTNIRIWQIDNGRLVMILKGHTSNVNSVTFNPSGEILASGSDDATIRLWQVRR